MSSFVVYFVILQLIDINLIPSTSQYFVYGGWTISLLIAIGELFHRISNRYWLFSGGITFALYRKSNDWDRHPTVAVLRLYHRNWREVASAINIEYRRIDKFSVALGLNRVVVTDSWIILISPYALNLVQTSDAQLRAIHADEHNVCNVFICMKYLCFSYRITVPMVMRRCNLLVFKWFAIRNRSIHLWFGECLIFVCYNLCFVFQNEFRNASRFAIEFVSTSRDCTKCYSITIAKRSICSNLYRTSRTQSSHYFESNSGIYVYYNLETFVQDLCLGCGTEAVNVKLEKRCIWNGVEERDDDGRIIAACSSCYCRPMW